MKCPNCGTDNRPGAKFCRQCATPLIKATAPGRATPSQASAAASLVVQRGPQMGQKFTLRDGINTIGRAADNDVLLSESSVSRHHARIMLQPEGVWIEDLGSTSGTFVNSQRVTGSAWLRSGDTVQVGGASMLGVQVGPVMAPAVPTAPPSVAAPTAAVPPVPAQPQAMQVCPQCGAQNRPDVRFCEQCAAPLVEGAPAVSGPPHPQRRPRRRLRATRIALLVLFLVSLLLLPAIGFARHATRDRPRLSQDEALQTASEMIVENYPQFADSTPMIQETEFDRDKGYRIVYTMSDAVETESEPVEFTRILVVSINAVTEEVSVAISQ